MPDLDAVGASARRHGGSLIYALAKPMSRRWVLASTLVQPSGPRLIVEPDDGLGPVLDFIASAQVSLLIKQFTFTDETPHRRRPRAASARASTCG